MRVLIFFLSFILSLETIAQRFEWVEFTPLAVLNANGGSGGLHVTGDEQGNLFTVSVFVEPIIVGEDTLYHGGVPGRPDIVIVKWSEQGEILKYRHINNFATNGNPDPQGLLYDDINNQLLFSLSSFYSGTPVTILANESQGDIPLSILTGSVLRFDDDLNFISKADLPGGSTYFSPIALHNGAIFSAHGYNMTISRVDEDNSIAWSHTVQGGFSTYVCTDILATEEHVFVIGNLWDGFGFNQAMTLNGYTIAPPPGSASGRTFIFKLAHDGTVMDGRFICETLGNNNSLRFTVDQNENVYLCAGYGANGQSVGEFMLDNLIGATDGFVAKLDENLTPLWVTELHHTGGNMEMRDILLSPEGKVTVIGLYGGNMSFANSNFDPAQYGSCFLVQLNALDGVELYGTNFGPLSVGTGRPYQMWSMGSNYFITGLSYGSNDNGLPGTAKYGCYTNTSLTAFFTLFSDQPFELPNLTLSYNDGTFIANSSLSNVEFSWMLNDEIIDKEGGTTLNAQGNGIYEVMIDYFGCTVSASYELCQVTATDIVEACSEFTWIDGVTYFESTSNPTYTMVSSTGCDSLISLNLTIQNVNTQINQEGFLLTALESNANYQWLDCSSKLDAIDGATSQSFQVTVDGYYAAQIQVGECIAVSDCIEVVLTKLEEKNSQVIFIYPVPASDFISIEGIEVGNRMIIFDAVGKQCMSILTQQTVERIDISNLAEGVYFLRINEVLGFSKSFIIH